MVGAGIRSAEENKFVTRKYVTSLGGLTGLSQKVKASMPQTEMKEIERSDGCFACDWNNPAGLGIRFYTDGQGAYGEYIPTEVYQGYKGIVHGGILAALLDEVMAKALAAHGIDGVTAKLEVRFRKPVPTNSRLLLRGWIKSRRKTSFVVAGQILAEDRETLVEAEGIFFKKMAG